MRRPATLVGSTVRAREGSQEPGRGRGLAEQQPALLETALPAIPLPAAVPVYLPASSTLPAAARSLCTRSLDIALLVWLAYLPTDRAHGLLVGVHLLRMAVANATRPLMRSGAGCRCACRRDAGWYATRRRPTWAWRSVRQPEGRCQPVVALHPSFFPFSLPAVCGNDRLMRPAASM